MLESKSNYVECTQEQKQAQPVNPVYAVLIYLYTLIFVQLPSKIYTALNLKRVMKQVRKQ